MKNLVRWPVFVSFLMLSLVACRPWYAPSAKEWMAQKPPADSSLRAAFFLIGDAGEWEADDMMQQTVSTQLRHAPDSAGVVFLGDNIYEWGLSAPGAKDHFAARAYLNAQLHTTDGFRGPVVFVPGNHDWAASYKFTPHGRASLKRQEDAVTAYGANYSFLPNNGCPGPTVKKMPNGWTLIVLDTQWWMQPDRPIGANCGCPQTSEEAVLHALDSTLKVYHGEKVILVGHHPVYDNGTHGGHYTLKDHLFPLTTFNKYLWVPLPVIGSIIIGTRMMLKHFADQTHPGYNKLSKGLKAILPHYPNVLYATGHEHNLQYHYREGVHYVVSGSGAKNSGVAQGYTAEYVDSRRGMAILKEYANGQVWLEYLAEGRYAHEHQVTYRRLLYQVAPHVAALKN